MDSVTIPTAVEVAAAVAVGIGVFYIVSEINKILLGERKVLKK